MADAFHFWSGDLVTSATGDILTADGLTEATQRILRRLNTNLGDYIWQLAYGAGLPSYIGKTLDYDELTGLIRAQMYLEPGVSQNPPPTIRFMPIANGLFVQIQYTDVESGQTVPLYFDVTP